MSDFKQFAAKAARQWAAMSEHELYRVSIGGDEIWDAYLAAFPEGTDPIFRVRRQHDGSYDRSVIKRIGNVVRICTDGSLMSIWDERYEYPYGEVAAVLSARVGAAAIDGLFRMKEPSIGCVENREPKTGLVFNHLHAVIAQRHRATSPAEAIGEAASVFGVFKRGLEEIAPAALREIAGMKGDLYRGEEFCPQAQGFLELQMRHTGDVFIWANIGHGLAKFRNSVVGTLAVDLSNGVETDRAVASFEAKVAPTNYKRPTAVITQGMVGKAMETIQSLGLEPALERRHARLSDMSVNNVLWMSNAAKGQMKDGVAALLDGAVTKKASGSSEEIGVADFVANVLPKARTLEMQVQNRHQKNLVSVTAPVHANATPLFKWGNGFAWSYNGDITDAIRERVKAAGGNVKADLRVSLAWHNHDDLDLHCEGPYGHIYFGDKKNILDVDMNAGSGITRQPVENLAFMSPRDGVYGISVHQYSRRETTNVGFTLEVEYGGKVEQLTYGMAVVGAQSCVVLKLLKGAVIEFQVVNKELKHQGLSQVVWGIQTESFVPVSTVMLSPNHWDGREIGNKHWFFLLDGCANPEPTRGIYNEFLRGDLEPHRKVFEVLGSKTKCQPSAGQLSGLGFSSTIRESVTVRAIGQTINKTYKVNF